MNWKRLTEMIRLYRNWPIALADRAGLLPAGRLVTFKIRTQGMNLSLAGETASGDVRVVNEMWLEDPYLRGFPEQLPASPCVVDIGANRGYFATHIAARHPRARIFSYEPEPRNAAMLRLNVARNDLEHQIEVRDAAVSPTPQSTVRLALAPLPGNHTMVPDSRELFDAPVITVSAVSIGDALSAALARDRRIDLLKLDVEGMEPALLRAIPANIFPRLVRIAAEIEDPSERRAIAAFLQDHGFTIRETDRYLYAWSGAR